METFGNLETLETLEPLHTPHNLHTLHSSNTLPTLVYFVQNYIICNIVTVGPCTSSFDYLPPPHELVKNRVFDNDLDEVWAYNSGYKASCELRGFSKFPFCWCILKYNCYMGNRLLLIFDLTSWRKTLKIEILMKITKQFENKMSKICLLLTFSSFCKNGNYFFVQRRTNS